MTKHWIETQEKVLLRGKGLVLFEVDTERYIGSWPIENEGEVGKERTAQLEGVRPGQLNVNIEWGVVFGNRVKEKSMDGLRGTASGGSTVLTAQQLHLNV